MGRHQACISPMDFWFLIQLSEKLVSKEHFHSGSSRSPSPFQSGWLQLACMCSLFSIAVANLAVKAASASKAVKAMLKRMVFARQRFHTNILVTDALLYTNSCCYFSEIPVNHHPCVRRVLFLCPRLLKFSFRKQAIFDSFLEAAVSYFRWKNEVMM